MSDDFSDYPLGISEAKSDRTGNAAHWKPRDVLINLLRRIDNGEKIDALVVAYTEFCEDGATDTGYLIASPNIIVTMGLLTRVQQAIDKDARPV